MSAFGFGFDLSSPFSNASLVQLARDAGFKWLPSSQTNCSFHACDVRVGDTIHVHRAALVDQRTAPGPLGPTPFAIHRKHNPGATFLAPFWGYVRREVAMLPTWRTSDALQGAGHVLRVHHHLVKSRGQSQNVMIRPQ